MRLTIRRWLAFVVLVCFLFTLPLGAGAQEENADWFHGTLDMLAQQPESVDEWYHFLLIGTDTRQNVENAGRSDTMIIASVLPREGRIKLASLARDMWVTIPGEGENKLNAAHSWGGPDLLLETINQNFHMNLTDYVSVNFYGLIDIIDAMGGVEVEITSAEAGVINNSVAKEHPYAEVTRLMEGKAHLCGVQALSYARIRKLDSDFGRTSRQRKLIGAMLDKVSHLNPLQLMDVAAKCMDAVTFRMGSDGYQLMGMLYGLEEKGLDGIEELSLPSRFRYHSNDGISKLLIDPEQVAQEWHAFVYGE